MRPVLIAMLAIVMLTSPAAHAHDVAIDFGTAVGDGWQRVVPPSLRRGDEMVRTPVGMRLTPRGPFHEVTPKLIFRFKALGPEFWTSDGAWAFAAGTQYRDFAEPHELDRVAEISGIDRASLAVPLRYRYPVGLIAMSAIISGLAVLMWWIKRSERKQPS